MELNDYISMFPGATREKLRFMALAEAVLSQVSDLFPVIGQLNSGFSLDTAQGKQLDQEAAAVGLKRNDAGANNETVTDAMFRDYIRAKLALWRWDGTNKDAADVFRGTVLSGSRLLDNQDGTVTAVLPDPVPEQPVTFRPDQTFPYPAGVRLEEESV